MKWFWLLHNANTKGANAYVGDVVDIGRDPEELNEAFVIANWPRVAFLAVGTTGQDGSPDDAVQNAFRLDIHSPRLRRAVEAAAVRDWQYFPIELRGSGVSHGTFWLAHVPECVDALDLSRSTVTLFPDDFTAPSKRGKLWTVDKPVLRRDALQGYDVIRLCSYPSPLFVSEHFREVVRSGRFTGYDFEEVGVA